MMVWAEPTFERPMDDMAQAPRWSRRPPDPTARAAERNVERDELSRLRERVGELSAENRRLRSALRKWASESLRGAESRSEGRGRRGATTNPNDDEKAARRDESASRGR